MELSDPTRRVGERVTSASAILIMRPTPVGEKIQTRLYATFLVRAHAVRNSRDSSMSSLFLGVGTTEKATVALDFIR